MKCTLANNLTFSKGGNQFVFPHMCPILHLQCYERKLQPWNRTVWTFLVITALE